MRKFLSVLTVLAFCTIWPLTILLTTFQLTFLNETFYTATLEKANAYERTTTVLTNNVTSLTGFESFPGDTAVATSIQQALIHVITPIWLQTQVETIIHSSLEVLLTPGFTVADISATISLAEPKSALIPILQSFYDQLPDDEVAPDWLQTFDTKAPNDIPIKYLIAAAVNKESLYSDRATMALPGDDFLNTENVGIINKQLATIQNALQWLKKITYGSIVLSFILLIGICLFARGFRSKFSSLGMALWVGSVGTAVSAAILYFGRDMTTAFISSQLPIAADWGILAKDILDLFIKQYTIYILWPSGAGLAIGTVLFIISKFIRKPS